MITYIITHWPTFRPQNSCNSPCNVCYNFFVYERSEIAKDIQAVVKQFRNIPTQWFQSSGLALHDIPRVLFGLKFGGLGLYDSNWNVALYSWNHSSICDMEGYSSGKLHFHLETQTLCKGASDTQQYSIFYSITNQGP